MVHKAMMDLRFYASGMQGVKVECDMTSLHNRID
jgi:hypothetical protein